MIEEIKDAGWIAAVFTFLTGLFNKDHIWSFLTGLTGHKCAEKIRQLEARESKKAIIYSRCFTSMETLAIVLRNIIDQTDPNYNLVQEIINNMPSKDEIKSLTDAISEDKESNTSNQ